MTEAVDLENLPILTEGGIYEEIVEQMAIDLKRSMVLVREMLFQE